MVTGNSIDNLTSYHPQRWASKTGPNSRVKNITAETAALEGKGRVLASPTVLQESALLTAAFSHSPHQKAVISQNAPTWLPAAICPHPEWAWAVVKAGNAD